jgi:hypothetical protein
MTESSVTKKVFKILSPFSFFRHDLLHNAIRVHGTDYANARRSDSLPAA